MEDPRDSREGERRRRLAEALRENLRRRKARARAVAETAPPEAQDQAETPDRAQ